MALQDRLDALKADFESGRFPLKPTKEALDTMRRATEELIASAQAQRARKAGDRTMRDNRLRCECMISGPASSGAAAFVFPISIRSGS